MSTSFRTFVIANPTSGSGVVRNEWSRIERALRATIPEHDVAFTERAGHATLLAREALRAGWEMVVAVGGDGTLNEVVNGYFEEVDAPAAYQLDELGWLRMVQPDAFKPVNPEAVVGVIPMGTGGDFRRTLGLMGGWREAVDHLGGRDTRQIDVGQMGYINHHMEIDAKVFANISSMGMGGLVDHLANNSWKGLGGQVSYASAVLRAFRTWQNIEVELRIDDVEVIRQDVMIGLVANGQYFGGGMWIAPGASLSDGRLQLQVIGDLSKPEALIALPSIYTGKHIAHEKVWRRNVRNVSIRAVNPAPGNLGLLDMDGEQPGRLPVHWSVGAGALRLKA